MHGDPWTEEADQELRQFANGRSNKEIAELAGRSERASVRLRGLREAARNVQ